MKYIFLFLHLVADLIVLYSMYLCKTITSSPELYIYFNFIFFVIYLIICVLCHHTFNPAMKLSNWLKPISSKWTSVMSPIHQLQSTIYLLPFGVCIIFNFSAYFCKIARSSPKLCIDFSFIFVVNYPILCAIRHYTPYNTVKHFNWLNFQPLFPNRL